MQASFRGSTVVFPAGVYLNGGRNVEVDDLNGRVVETPKCRCKEHDFFLELK
ncbi:MAG: hypothetical protein LLG04_08090 [Parachlamydia sp.]|nr:hypothetical protein [Parachlamydia sp.]